MKEEILDREKPLLPPVLLVGLKKPKTPCLFSGPKHSKGLMAVGFFDVYFALFFKYLSIVPSIISIIFP